MTVASFLDTGVVLAYCFRDDGHHFRCKEYLNKAQIPFFVSDHVEAEYLNRHPSLAEEIAEGVFEHIDRLRTSSYEGQLDSMDTSKIRQNLIAGGNKAATSLNAFYKDQIPKFIHYEDLEERLRNLARDIEQNAIENQDWLLERTEMWCRENEYPDIDDILSAIPPDDRRICIDAHDVVVETENPTELATVNPRDFIDDGMKELILSHTALEDVVTLAKRS